MCFRFIFHSHFIKEDHAWQLKQLKNRDTSQAGLSRQRVLLHQMRGFPGGNPSLLDCNTSWLCLELPFLLLSLWALTQTQQFSSQVSVHSSSFSLSSVVSLA